MLLLLVGINAVVLVLHLQVRVFVTSAILALVLIMWPLDAFTVRLVQPGRWRGWWRGYENRDAMTRFDPILLALAFIFFLLAVYYFLHL